MPGSKRSTPKNSKRGSPLGHVIAYGFTGTFPVEKQNKNEVDFMVKNGLNSPDYYSVKRAFSPDDKDKRTPPLSPELDNTEPQRQSLHDILNNQIPHSSFSEHDSERNRDL